MKQKQQKIRTLSVFTGAGGLDIGFHLEGFEIFACVELHSTFCETLKLNVPKYYDRNCQIINADICELDPNDIDTDSCDFIIGGPPCQSFSAAGRRAGGVTGVNDHRGTLFEHYCRFIKHFKPSGFLFENVRGILSANKREDWDTILSTFSDLGYDVAFRVLDAADYGVPQHRERVILVGTRKGSQFLFPRPTHGPDSLTSLPHVSCGAAIASLQEPDEPIHDYGGKYGDLLKDIPPGRNYLHFTREMGHPNPVFAWRSRFSDFLYKAHPDQVSKTIVARLGAYSGPFHWKNRRFNIAEYKRLFTFPDDYKLAGGDSIMSQQLGNSVVPAFAQQLARAVLKQVFVHDVKVDLLPEDAVLSFDSRKGKKARSTRRRRLENTGEELTLFTQVKEETRACKADSEQAKEKQNVYYANYQSWKNLTRIINPSPSKSDKSFMVVEKQKGGHFDLTVSRIAHGKACTSPLLTYDLLFQWPIGEGLEAIKCVLQSKDDEDIVAVWDAIEHVLNKQSNYGSMMDVFGHFTEPHPIFDLKMEIDSDSDSFLLRFAKLFSDFSRAAVDYPVTLLASLHDEPKDFNFLETVKWLRGMRFDVRVFETNRTIPPGFFRCCYPFTIHVNKQISVTWKSWPHGNISGVQIPSMELSS